MSEETKIESPTKGMEDWVEPVKREAPKAGLAPAVVLSFIEHESGGKMPATRFECCEKDAEGRCIKGTSFGKRAGCPEGTQRLDKKGRPVVSRGPFQFLIGTAEQYGLPADRHEELNTNPDLALEIGLKMLSDLHKRYAGDLYYIAAAYNGGPGGADKAFKKKTRVANDHAHAYAGRAKILFDKWQEKLG